VPHERADPQHALLLCERVEAGDPVDVDEYLRRGETQLEQRDQALTAGEDLGILAVLAQQLDGLFERAGSDIVER
jgi:hypothetical protein